MKAFLSHKHKYLYKIENDQVIISRAKVRPGKARLKVVLKALHAQRAIDQDGVANTQKCTMAQCLKDQASIFPHPFVGYIAWYYSRVYVASKLDRDHKPCECYVYKHSDEIGRLNDSKGGQQKLLADLLKHGDRVIELRPFIVRSHQKRVGQGTRDGTRSPRIMFHGAKLRYATAKLGGVEV